MPSGDLLSLSLEISSVMDGVEVLSLLKTVEVQVLRGHILSCFERDFLMIKVLTFSHAALVSHFRALEIIIAPIHVLPVNTLALIGSMSDLDCDWVCRSD